ncbi:hypothetical protein OH76DRAFT_1424123, partial [Lentinus brumalis]
MYTSYDSNPHMGVKSRMFILACTSATVHPTTPQVDLTIAVSVTTRHCSSFMFVTHQGALNFSLLMRPPRGFGMCHFVCLMTASPRSQTSCLRPRTAILPLSRSSRGRPADNSSAIEDGGSSAVADGQPE